MMLLPVFLLLAPVLISCEEINGPADCSDIYKQNQIWHNGVYSIYPIRSTTRCAVEVYCDMETAGGRWTVFQRRMDGSVNFYRPYDQYKTGFGNAAGEYWLGLENIHQLTSRQNYELLVNVEDFEGNAKFAFYSLFKVDTEFEGYRLHVTGFNSSGGAGDSLYHHNGRKFSTFDKDQDDWPNNCARSFLGAFWYGNCHDTNPNGIYQWGADRTHYATGVTWDKWKDEYYSLKGISMKIRPVQ
ncbi:microfibril-associated glycoprotein 4 [Austrofundulus limnaeus]|uniref:Microfibril-associated glycoprotein 4 n=1 Tax=Austrofundulus limnaeus TaxID=52670 RepID=A0A2I4CA42_AUSLI|nr:PREDICTED: microfibril-associated glycoprotein 4-like [Austrofundulus limnaeus]